jgi:lipopolysaccharide biosynthesis glycosyltransferase
MANQGDRVEIAMLSNQAYLEGLKVTAASIALYADPAVRLRLHVLDGGIEDDAFARFASQISRLHAHVEVCRHRVEESLFADWPTWNGNRMTYARLLMPRLLADCDRVIYTDTDVLWLAPVDELWQMLRGDALILAARDNDETSSRENAWYASKGLSAPGDDYFCAGVMAVDLEGFRRENVIERVFEFLSAHKDAKFADQTALNTLLPGRVQVADSCWQTLTPSLRGPLCGPIVLHYANEVPWRQRHRWNLLSDAAVLWHAFNDSCCGKRQGAASLQRHYTRNEVLFKRGLFLAMQVPGLAALLPGVAQVAHRGDIASQLRAYIGRGMGWRCRNRWRREWRQRIRSAAGPHP